MRTVGVVGFGHFGQFCAQWLGKHCQVVAYDPFVGDPACAADLATLGACQYVILAVPLEAYADVIRDVRPYLHDDTVLVDVCSIKTEAAKQLTRMLPNQPRVLTHPLFGPESARHMLAGHTLVMCPDGSTDKPYQAIKTFAATTLELTVVEMSAKEHDREMAVIQGLTFFVARGLSRFGVYDQKLSTPSFRKLQAIVEQESHHTPELFRTTQNGNRYTPAVRKRIMSIMEAIDQELQGTTPHI